MKPYYQDEWVQIYLGDCRDILPHLPKVDLVLTDPPYGMNDKWGKGWEECKSGRSRLWGETPSWDKDIFQGIEAVIEKGNHSIIWGGNYYPLAPTNAWLIWYKMQEFSGSEAEMAWTNLPLPVRVFNLSRGAAHSLEHKEHPTQKPISLIKWCIVKSGDNINIILDPFLGSGTTAVASKSLNRHCIGIEIEEKYCEIARNRLRQSVMKL